MELLDAHRTAVVARTNPAKASEVWLVSLHAAAPPTRIVSTADDFRLASNAELSDRAFQVIGALDGKSVYLARRPTASGQAREVWRLSTDGQLSRAGTLAEDGRGTPQFRVRPAPNGSRVAFVTGYQLPAAPLELVTFENLPIAAAAAAP
jgi:hypothetical protein